MPEAVAPKLPEGVNPMMVELIDGVYYDKCVLCLKTTDMQTNRPVATRPHYVEGCGQLCPDCWDMTEE